MIASQFSLTDKQGMCFDRFLQFGTEKALSALETVFGLDIESSDSSIEVAPIPHSKNLQHLGAGELYTVSSSMLGEMQGRAILIMRADDFDNLSEVLKPVLNLIFLASPDTDLATIDADSLELDQGVSQQQMMDTLQEIGNILIGLYTKAIYRTFQINTHHSVPEAVKDPEQRAIQQFLASTDLASDMHLVIENEFFLTEKAIKLWCLISPTRESFQQILSRIECQESACSGTLQ